VENFIFQNETKIIFGKDTELEVGVEVSRYGKKYYSIMVVEALKGQVFMIR